MSVLLKTCLSTAKKASLGCDKDPLIITVGVMCCCAAIFTLAQLCINITFKYRYVNTRIKEIIDL